MQLEQLEVQRQSFQQWNLSLKHLSLHIQLHPLVLASFSTWVAPPTNCYTPAPNSHWCSQQCSDWPALAVSHPRRALNILTVVPVWTTCMMSRCLCFFWWFTCHSCGFLLSSEQVPLQFCGGIHQSKSLFVYSASLTFSTNPCCVKAGSATTLQTELLSEVLVLLLDLE